MSRILAWSEWLLNLLGAALVAVVLVAVCAQVVMRYVFNNATMWSDPVASAAMAWLTFVAMAAAVRSDGNMYVRFTWDWLSEGGRRVAEAISLLMAIVFAVALSISALQLMEVTKTATVEGLPIDVSWATMYSISLLSAAFVIIFTIERLLHLFAGVRK
jgi:TRAP-type C4-dicarboxylate transport system permease small subunit